MKKYVPAIIMQIGIATVGVIYAYSQTGGVTARVAPVRAAFRVAAPRYVAPRWRVYLGARPFNVQEQQEREVWLRDLGISGVGGVPALNFPRWNIPTVHRQVDEEDRRPRWDRWLGEDAPMTNAASATAAAHGAAGSPAEALRFRVVKYESADFNAMSDERFAEFIAAVTLKRDKPLRQNMAATAPKGEGGAEGKPRLRQIDRGSPRDCAASSVEGTAVLPADQQHLLDCVRELESLHTQLQEFRSRLDPESQKAFDELRTEIKTAMDKKVQSSLENDPALTRAVAQQRFLEELRSTFSSCRFHSSIEDVD